MKHYLIIWVWPVTYAVAATEVVIIAILNVFLILGL